MAETGQTGQLVNELARLGDGVVDTIRGFGLGSAAGTVTEEFNIDQYHPLVSVVSMIAPSPDWFIGVDSVPLCNGTDWVKSVTYNLYPWDADTDGGTTYTSGDVGKAHGNIFRIRPSSGTDMFKGSTDGPIGEMTFMLVSHDVKNTFGVKNPFCRNCVASETCKESYDGGCCNLSIIDHRSVC